MKKYISPEIIVVSLDTEAVLMANSPIGWGDGETGTMEAPQTRGRGWSEYEQE
ncbi:MAG: hypothetical protein K6E86_01505 [Bacteroidales bacterium]|nr:hypothetical protein [Bacteroidales bacterium]